MIAKVLRYWRTIRHLKLRQVLHRAAKLLPRPAPSDTPLPRRHHSTLPVVWAGRRPSLVGPTRFRFLNREQDLEQIGWDSPGLDKLWRYNQHYFDDLNAEGSRERRDWHAGLLERWVNENPVGVGTAWEPYPTSLRIVNWVKGALSGLPLSTSAQTSLAIQARWLERRLEYHLLGNHLFANAKALVFAGVFFEGHEAESFRRLGIDIISRELDEQFLADGGHFELSPMYHALGLEDLLDLINLCRVLPGLIPKEIEARVRQKASRAIEWCQALIHPDGEVAHFNDSVRGIAPAPTEVFRYASDVGVTSDRKPSSVQLSPSGYVRLEVPNAAAILDVAAIGPDYLPGHAHADSLSFELSVFGKRVVVNTGISTYGTSDERQRQRGTRAHSTVIVDERDSSEVWSGFRVARRARTTIDSVVLGVQSRVAASHDGYRRKPIRTRHRRFWEMDPGRLTVEDSIGERNNGIAIFHFHPQATASSTGEDQFSLRMDGGQAIEIRVRDGRGSLHPSRYHPEFGISQAATALEVELQDGSSKVDFYWG